MPSHSGSTRRTFCAAVAALGESVWAATSNGKIRVAMIGTGHGHAASKIRALRTLPEYEFVGICRPDGDEPNQAKCSVRCTGCRSTMCLAMRQSSS